ncbi:xylulokinase [Angomonas deanei]|uniref:glycerol kinase n=1 Tax=Angomonas deanei TaxID=59799 RepID=A0A7G2C4M8_9TRYP|nr:xylulokinase [Angomonas deanei]CAD2214104.1 FGGY family of carbohydrate kinases, N-terminal domain/FGGY family of carbohydrate kinases, C-terminal domain containing protein, putative [Angomonas deanei]|eukprot:EPY32054.1 xylulokinase [Angomonas deanei]
MLLKTSPGSSYHPLRAPYCFSLFFCSSFLPFFILFSVSSRTNSISEMFLGIDLGTSGIKVVLTSPSGEILASESRQLSVSRPRPLWNEQDPEDWWKALDSSVLALKAKHDMKKVKGVGLSGQMHGSVLLDKSGHVIRPCILWCDGRCAAECKEIERNVPTSRTITGNIIMPGFTAGKLLWVKKNEPENFEKVDMVLLPKDYLRFCMSGVYASEMSDSSGTMWMDVKKRDWSDEILRATFLSRKNMPKLFEGSEVTANISEKIASRWGMNQVPIVGGGGDNEAGAVGCGLFNPGQAMLSLGTSGVYFMVSDGFYSNTEEAVHSFCHALPKRWHLMSVMLSCAVCLDWASKLTGCTSVSQFVDEASKARDFDKRPVFFLPYLEGERTPHNNPDAKGVFFGLTSDHKRPELARSVLEGVSFALAQGMDAVHKCCGMPSSISLIGGGTKSPFWRQMLADVSGLPLNYCVGSEVGPSLGACRLAQLGVEKQPIEQVVTPLKVQQVHQPDMARHEAYQKRRKVFEDLYKALKPVYGKL